MDDLKHRLRDASFIAFDDGGNDYTTAQDALSAIEALEAQVRAADALAEVCMTVDGYLTRLQTPGTEPLNSVNGSAAKQDRNYFTAQVRNEAREQWAALGNALAAYSAAKEGGA